MTAWNTKHILAINCDIHREEDSWCRHLPALFVLSPCVPTTGLSGIWRISMDRLTILPNRTYPQSDPTRLTNNMRQHPTTASPRIGREWLPRRAARKYPCMSVKGGEISYHVVVDGQRKCPAKWPAKMSLVLLAMITDGSYSTRSRFMGGLRASMYFFAVSRWMPSSRATPRVDNPLRFAF